MSRVMVDLYNLVRTHVSIRSESDTRIRIDTPAAEEPKGLSKREQVVSKMITSAIYVKVYGPYSFSKDTLRENGCLWLIKCLGHVSLSDVRQYF
jgi:hypothetical protein